MVARKGHNMVSTRLEEPLKHDFPNNITDDHHSPPQLISNTLLSLVIKSPRPSLSLLHATRDAIQNQTICVHLFIWAEQCHEDEALNGVRAHMIYSFYRRNLHHHHHLRPPKRDQRRRTMLWRAHVHKLLLLLDRIQNKLKNCWAGWLVRRSRRRRSEWIWQLSAKGPLARNPLKNNSYCS